MADRTVKVTLSAQVQGYVADMAKAAQATRETGTEAEKLAQKGQAFEQMGRASMIAGGSIAAGLGLAAKAAIDWDSAWAGVTKTVDGTPAQMAAVEQGLRDLTSVLPASHAEIAAVAEAAGQLGIQTPQVVEFTRTMIDMGETTNLSAEDAATSLARFMTVMGTAQAEVSGLGSALVDLGNNYATTEAEIMAMAMRLAGAGAQIGMSEGQVLGLSTALSSVGIEAEAGGSAMSKVMIDIASSVDKGGDRVKQFAEVAGMSADAFSAKWKTAPGEALAAFVKGLANAEAQGKSTFGILEELGITEVRMRDALLRSASAADQFAGAMQQGDKAMEANTALTAEAEKRYETTAAKLGIMRNKVVDAAITLGQQLLPAIEGVADGLGGFADMLGGLDGPMAGVAAWGGLIAAGILLTGGVALAAVPKIAAYKVALETLNVSSSTLKTGVRGIATFLTGPWGIALGLGAATAITFGNALKEGRSSAAELTSAIKGTADGANVLNEAMSGQGKLSKTVFGDYAEEIKNLGEILRENNRGGGVWEWLNTDFNDAEMLERIKGIGEAMVELSETDLSSVQESFRQMAEGANLSDEEMSLLLSRMGPFRDKLIELADSMGISTDETNLLKIATGELKPRLIDSGDAALEASKNFDMQADATKQINDELSKLIDSLNEFNGIGQAAESQNSRYRETLADVAETIASAQQGLEGYSASLDASTAAGAKNREMFANQAADAQASARAYFDQESATLGAGAAVENYVARLSDARQTLIDNVTALTGNADAAAALADQIFKMPTAYELQILTEGADETSEKLSQVDENARKIPGAVQTFVTADTGSANTAVADYIRNQGLIKTDVNTVVTAETSDAMAKFNILQDALNALGRGVHVPVSADAPPLSPGWSPPAKSANGNLFEFANGGGLSTGIYRGGTPITRFAEQETIWEAFISGKPSERDRNRQIWVGTGQRLGMLPENGASGGVPAVYVQNPWTGDYLLAKTVQVAEGAVDGYVRESAQADRMVR